VRARALVLVLLMSCGRVGFHDTSDGGAPDAAISGATRLNLSLTTAGALSVTALTVRFAFPSLDPTELFAIPADGSTPALPGAATFVLPDVTTTLTLTLDATDTHGRIISTTATADITRGSANDVAVELGSGVASGCIDGVTDNGETDIDCGGPCAPCAYGERCVLPDECSTTNCSSNECETVSGTPQWEFVHDMPVGRIGLAAALGADGLIYVYGGAGATGENVAEVDAYDPLTDTWSSAPALATPRSRIAGTRDDDGTVYAIGGGSGGPDVVETLAFGSASWGEAPALPTGRDSPAAALGVNGKVYTFGGAVGSAFTPTGETDELDGNSWTQRMPMPTPRSNLAAARGLDGTLLTIGGHPSQSDIVEAYDPNTNQWKTLPSLIQGRSDHAAVLGADGRTYAIGGFDGVASGIDTVEAYRTGDTQWFPVSPLQDGRDSCAAALGYDGHIYVFGGRATNDGSPLTSVAAYGPRIQLSSTDLAAGSTVTLAGDNFAANAKVYVMVDAIPVALSSSDDTGVLATLQLHIPATAASGSHAVYVYDDHSLYPVNLPFTVP
jgi:N-acetylneuraminic acid mutarotase